ncbi:MAG: carbohydrate porin, partial [Candidatus Omnitrophica bacterium]|nr:carbohydrate porin [Candidatus Omnitrophota bacterium]
RIYAELEVDKNKGIDKFIPTFSWFNYNSTENASLYVPVCYLTQDLFNDRLFLAAGKTDLSNWFDTNVVAGSADTQFSSAALVNNPVLPLPTKNMGVFVSYKPNELMNFQAGAATGDYFPTMIGFSNAFRNQIFLGEFDFSPKWRARQGNYRFIFCSDREKYDFINAEGVRRNNYSFALSLDQEITNRLTLFARYGLGDPKVKDVEYFWSAGGQFIEPIPGRKYDCLGLGVAQSLFGDDYLEANGPDLARSEIMYELYYSLRVKEYFYVTPNLQFVQHPNADKQEGEAAACGVRFLLTF